MTTPLRNAAVRFLEHSDSEIEEKDPQTEQEIIAEYKATKSPEEQAKIVFKPTVVKRTKFKQRTIEDGLTH